MCLGDVRSASVLSFLTAAVELAGVKHSVQPRPLGPRSQSTLPQRRGTESRGWGSITHSAYYKPSPQRSVVGPCADHPAGPGGTGSSRPWPLRDTRHPSLVGAVLRTESCRGGWRCGETLESCTWQPLPLRTHLLCAAQAPTSVPSLPTGSAPAGPVSHHCLPTVRYEAVHKSVCSLFTQ